MIKDLNWDTDFFGFKVGKIELSSDDTISLTSEIWNAIKLKYKLIYFFLDPLFTNAEEIIRKNGGYLVDEKVTFRYDISDDSQNIQQHNIEILDSTSPELINLTLQSGLYSRFRNDVKIPQSKFEQMYTIWINNSFKRDDIKVFGYYSEMKLLKGFVTLKVENNNGIIELIAVDNDFRSEGIGTKLLKQVIHFSVLLNLESIFVNTQKMNMPACSFYQKNNFKFYNQVNIYHFWNNNL